MKQLSNLRAQVEFQSLNLHPLHYFLLSLMFSEVVQVSLPKLNNVTRLFYNAYKCCGSEIQKSYNYRDGLSLLLFLWLPITEGECSNGDKRLEVSCLLAFLISRLG